MENKSLRDTPIEELVSQIRAHTPQAQAQTVGALAAGLTIELARSLDQVSLAVFEFKKSVATASTDASAQTTALVKWTKVLAWLTGAYTVITGGLLLVAIASLRH